MILSELCEREVIEVGTGANLGHVDDIAFLPESAMVTHIVLYGKWKLFGLLGREEDTYIPWQDIRKVGKDVLLVETSAVPEERKKRLHFWK